MANAHDFIMRLPEGYDTLVCGVWDLLLAYCDEYAGQETGNGCVHPSAVVLKKCCEYVMCASAGSIF